MSTISPTDQIAAPVGAAGSASDRALFVESRRTRLLFAQARTSTVVTTMVSAVVASVYWPLAPTSMLLGWMLAMGVVLAWRYLLLQRFLAARPGDEELASWRRHFLLGAALGGLVFGMSGWLLAPYGSLSVQYLLVFAVAGMGLGAVPVLGSVMLAFNAYVGALFAPMVLWLLSQGTEVHTAMGVFGLVLGGALWSTARNYGRVLEQSLVLARENTDLEQGLSYERTISHALRERARLLKEHEARVRDFADMGADLFWESDPDLRYTYLSASYQSLTGVSTKRMLGRRVDDALGPCFLPDALCAAGTAPSALSYREHHVQWTRPDGSASVLLSHGKPVYDEAQQFLGMRGTVKDVTEQHDLAEQLKYQANHDHLTGLINRREFERRCQRSLDSARSTATRHAVCYLDLDQFKIVNDTCGHAAGDELLRQIASALSALVRDRDTLARLGGDEFGLLLEHCSTEAAVATAEKLRAEIEALRFQWDGRSFRVSASIGIAVISEASESVAAMMACVDAACFAAKEGGRNRVYLYESDDEDLARRHGEMQWVSRITQGLEDDRFELAVQPIVGLASGSGERFEILLRMRASDGSLVLPGVFLPAAERYNLAPTLDRVVIDKTFAWLARDRDRLAALEQCAVNLSAHSLVDREFPRFLTERFDRYGVPPEKICFEITETAAISRLTEAAKFMREVGALGCEFSLDDFGTGLSSFAYLKNLPVDYIKIDGLFVREAALDPVSLAMVRSIHDIGHVMGKRTIAECVEDEAVLAVVRAIGIDYAQGYAIGKPRLIDAANGTGPITDEQHQRDER